MRWLQEQGLDPASLAQGHVNLLLDPMRNGLLLLQLAGSRRLIHQVRGHFGMTVRGKQGQTSLS